MKKVLLMSLVCAFLTCCAPQTESVTVTGKKGDRGDVGPAGMSAYDLAVKNGFDGTEYYWLQSLVGATGQAGADGQNGAAGMSAYEVYKTISGNENKTLEEFISSLTGPAGATGPTGLQGQTGPQGQSCVVSKSGSVATIACGVGNSVTVSDGVNGQDASSSVRVVKFCPNSLEYGLVINNELYAVFHKDLYQGNGSGSHNGSNTYLAKLTLGSSYVTTDGTNCTFTASLN